jgi:hypothetical protein
MNPSSVVSKPLSFTHDCATACCTKRKDEKKRVRKRRTHADSFDIENACLKNLNKSKI